MTKKLKITTDNFKGNNEVSELFSFIASWPEKTKLDFQDYWNNLIMCGAEMFSIIIVEKQMHWTLSDDFTQAVRKFRRIS